MNYVAERRRMFSGKAKAESKKFKKYVGKSGARWFVAIQDNPADNIYVSPKDEKTSDGFGGATLSFELEDGTVEKVRGPWHSNSHSFLKDTDIDITDKHRTFTVVSKHRDYDKDFNTIMKDVFYIDSEPVIGKFDRGKIIAQQIANAENSKVAVYIESEGGSSNSIVFPESKEI